MPSPLEIAQDLNSKDVTVRGVTFRVRALKDSESAAITRLFPRPMPPITRRDTTKGSAAPLLPEPNDPAYIAANEQWTRRRWLYEIALATEVVKLVKGDDTKATADLTAAADALSDKMTEPEIVRVWTTTRDLFDETAQTRARDSLVVDTTDIPADQLAETKLPPESYGTTPGYLDFRVCERFKIDPAALADMDGGWKIMLREYEKFRQWEEARES